MAITNAKFIISSPDVAQCPQTDLFEYAFIGRSNVGKSSLINMLTAQKGLAKTSSKPGKTLLINHFQISSQISKNNYQNWNLVDLPGYGYAKAGKTERDKLRKMIERYCLLREQLICLFVLIDSRLEPQQIDLEFMQWLGEQGIPFAIVFTKADKLGKDRLRQNINAYNSRLLEDWEELMPQFITSAESGLGRQELTEYIENTNLELTKNK